MPISVTKSYLITKKVLQKLSTFGGENKHYAIEVNAWNDFNPSIDMQLYPLQNVRWNYFVTFNI